MRCALVSLVALAVASSTSAATDQKCFPDAFLFGAATASYQVEGGWNATGRTPSVWDDYCRAVPTLECANVADDFVHRYKADIDLMVETGLSSFRFSVSWSRAMNWDAATQRMAPNAPGLAFYHAVIDTLRAKGIAPILTLYHWDLPRELQQDLSPQGWLNPALGDHFQQYAELLFTEFGTKVTYWSTFNEPHSFITAGYSFGSGPPALPPSATNAYVVAHNVLVAHGKAVQSFRAFQAAKKVLADAKIGMVLNTDYSYPLDPSNAADVAAAERRTEFFFGWFLEPLVSGEYPAIMRERVGDRLPVFTPHEQALVKASYDVLMLNHYGSKNIVDCASPQSSVACSSQTLGWEADLGIDDSHMPDGARHASTGPNGEYLCKWFSAYPPGYLDSIRWLHKHDPSAPILLTENGWCGNATIDNQDQLWYFQNYLEQVHTALTVDKIPIIGYTAWSFVDNYEWGSFKPRFGLYYVNYTADTGCKNGYEPKATDLARIPRTAAKWYARVAKTKCLGDDRPTAVAMVGDRDGVSPLSFLTRGSMVLVPVAALAAMAALVLRQRRRRRPATAGETAPLLRP